MNAAGTLAKGIVVTVAGVLSTTSVALAATLTAPPQPAPAYLQVPLGSLATYAVSNIYANAPTGPVTLGGVPFTVANTGWAMPGSQFSVPTSTHATVSVNLLLNSSNATLGYSGQAVGKLHLTFSDGSVQDTNLVVGGNVREWWTGSGWLVDTLSDPSTKNVWQGAANPSVGAHNAIIDMLSVKVAPTTANLTGVSIVNAATAPYDIFTSGLTVAYQPTVVSGGNGDQKGNQDDKKDVKKVKPPVHPTPKPKPVDKNDKTVKPVVLKTGDADKTDKSEKTDKGGNHERHGDN